MMINQLQTVIAAFADEPNGARMGEALRYFSEHPDQQGEGYEDKLTQQFCIPSLLRIIQCNTFRDVPVDLIVDEMIDYAGIFFANNARFRDDGKLVIAFYGSEIQAGERDLAIIIAAFHGEFTSYLEKVMGDPKNNC